MTLWERTAEGLLVADANGFTDKTALFAAAGAAGMHAIFDFDRTLTVKRPGTNDEVTTWHILCEHLPPEGQRRYHELFAANRPLEMSGQMTTDDAVRWWSSILNLFVEYGIDLAAVEDTFLERASIRPGTVELFEALAEHHIPTIILSAGIRDVIDLWLHHYTITPSLVISTALELDERHKIVGWQTDTLVHALNKSEANHPELAQIRASRPCTLLVGDGLDDAAMAPGTNNVIRTRVLDPRPDEKPGDAERATFKRFDALISTGSLAPLQKFVRRIA